MIFDQFNNPHIDNGILMLQIKEYIDVNMIFMLNILTYKNCIFK